jgi:carboxyl-terminal processing protease
MGGASLIGATRSNKTDIQRNLDIFNALFKELQLNYVDSLDSKKAINTAITYMLDDIDPYTVYYSSDETEELSRISTGEYGGVGSIITKGRDGRVRFAEPYEGTPSHKAGILAGDIILQIDTTRITPKSSIADVSERLRGNPGTHVSVTIQRPYPAADADSVQTIDIERAKINTPAVTYYGTVGDDNRTGYILLSSFTEKAPGDVKNALTDMMKNHGITSLVLDLQGNPGGLLESAVEIVELFVPKGTEVVRTRGKGTLSEKVYKTMRAPVAPNMPLTVLIDENSASSSEIVAGSLQDLDRAVIVGQRSYGKGLVQSSRSLPYDGMLKLTVAKYYIPSGRLIQAIDYSRRNEDGSVARTPDSLTTVYRTIHGREVRDGGGITPDVKVELPRTNRLLYNIRRDNWDFDYATRFAAEHPTIASPREFTITDQMFADFKASINPEEFHYDRACESVLKTLREAVDTEGYMSDDVDAQISALEKTLHHNLDEDLDKNRPMLETLLISQIVPRYYYQSGTVDATLRYNDAMKEAVKILADQQKYKEILNIK